MRGRLPIGALVFALVVSLLPVVLADAPPHVRITSPAGGSTVNGTTAISGNAWDDVQVTGRSGDHDVNDSVVLVQVAVDAGAWTNATPGTGGWDNWSFDWNTTLVDDGWHAFYARAFDGDLYSEKAVAEYFVDNVPDVNHRPLVAITHPMGGEIVSGIVLVHGTASDPDVGDRVELVQVTIDPTDPHGVWRDAVDTSHDASWSTWAYQWDTTTVDNGGHKVCARSFDGDLYSEGACREVTVHNGHEKQRPKVSILHPMNGERVEGLVLIHGRASDDVGVKLVEVRFNDGDWHHATDTSPGGSWTTWAYEWDTTKRDDGCLHVSARAWDGSLFSEVYTIL